MKPVHDVVTPMKTIMNHLNEMKAKGTLKSKVPVKKITAPGPKIPKQ